NTLSDLHDALVEQKVRDRKSPDLAGANTRLGEDPVVSFVRFRCRIDEALHFAERKEPFVEQPTLGKHEAEEWIVLRIAPRPRLRPHHSKSTDQVAHRFCGKDLLLPSDHGLNMLCTHIFHAKIAELGNRSWRGFWAVLPSC